MSRWLVVELLVDPPEKRPKGLGEAEELMSQVYTSEATSRVSPAPSCSFPMNIAKRLGLTPEENDSEESLAGKLFDFLKNKNCLLFLDELWAPLDLGKLGDGT
ncbi:hypothetical protein BHE74_00050794 [Ensete ventricosum]|nr:hypothetical protein BHE74_00050794 [Ensete ventricosum]